MNTEFVQIAGPAVSLFGIFATPFVVKLSNWASSKADRREDYRCCEEFMEKLKPDTPRLVVEKWYEAVSDGDMAEAEEVHYMRDLRFPSQVFRLRKRAMDHLEFIKPGTAEHAGYRFKGLLKYLPIRVVYVLGNIGLYFFGFGLPAIPAIFDKWDRVATDWHGFVLYGLLCAMGFGLGATRIRATIRMDYARQLVSRSQETPSPKDGLSLVPSEDKDRAAA